MYKTNTSLQIAKKLIDSDFKNNRVSDPSHIDSKTRKKLIQYVTQFFEKAVVKKKDREDKKKTERPSQQDESMASHEDRSATGASLAGDGDPMVLDENESSFTNQSPSLGKRRREDEETGGGAEHDDSLGKKLRIEQSRPPPPPPPPPSGNTDKSQMTDAGRTPSEEPANRSAINKEEGPGFTIKGIARASSKTAESPTQVATPPTTGSPDGSEREKQRREYSGMNPDRMRLIEGGGNR